MRSRLIKALILFAFVCLFARNAFGLMGGNEVGNGGNAVVCGEHAELLDIYEAGILRKMKVDSKIKGTNAFEIANTRIEMLSGTDPKTAKIIAKGLRKLKDEISFESDLKLRPIDDSRHSFEPSDPKCHIEQLAVLRKKVMPGEKRVLVNEVIWKKMTPIHQAGLLLHESIYKYLSNLGEKDSTKARYLVTFILSDALNTPDSYWEIIKKFRLPIYR